MVVFCSKINENQVYTKYKISFYESSKLYVHGNHKETHFIDLSELISKNCSQNYKEFTKLIYKNRKYKL